jgi:dihydroorotase
MARYDLAITGGRVVDPAAGLNDYRDVAFRDGVVVAVEARIDPRDAAETIDATGSLVTPGFIDAHVHIFPGVSHYGVVPDDTCLPHGATTVVDAGSAGADTFPGFRRYVIEASETRIFAHLNISSMGMICEEIGELDDIKWANIPKALAMIERNRDVILGVKVRLTKDQICSEASGIRPLFLAREAADAAGLPIMVHPQDSWAESIDQVLAVLRGGDQMTHMYHGMRHGIFGDDGRIRRSVHEARERGVHFDVGHGAGSFKWGIAEAALEQGFTPTTISSDLHTHNIDGPVFDLVTVMSKFLHLGMPLEEMLSRVTSTPAAVIGQAGRLGTLAVGAAGDAVVVEIEEGRFPLVDSHGETRVAPQRVLPRVVVKAGKRVTREGRTPLNRHVHAH